MTGTKNYSSEKLITLVGIEGKPWNARLYLFCQNGSLSFDLAQSRSPDYKSIKLDRRDGFAELRIKFDNNEPFLTGWEASETNPGRVNFYDYFIPVSKEIDNLPENLWHEAIKMRQEIRKQWQEILKGMIKHRRLWIGFTVKTVPHVAKFDLTGFSRELAKCSRIPDIN